MARHRTDRINEEVKRELLKVIPVVRTCSERSETRAYRSF